MKYFLIAIWLFSLPSFSQERIYQETIDWISLEEAQERVKTEPRKILIDVFTNWCGPCRMMNTNTFVHHEIVRYINNNFYAVKFNAEGPNNITFKGVVYSNPDYDPEAKGRNSLHELTYKLAALNGQIAYPTVVYLDENLDILTPIQGYFTPRQLSPVLKFFGSGSYKKTTWKIYSANFSGILNE